MSQKFVVFMLALVAAVLIAACGTIPDPIFKITPEVDVVTEGEGTVVAQIATSTPIPPTATPIPPTSTPEPTLEPTLEAEVTVDPTETTNTDTSAVVVGDASYGADDSEKFGVDNFGDATRGEALFNQTWDLPTGEQWACSQCHNIVGEEEKIGPSLYNVGERALTRVAGEGPYTYLYNSIINSQAHIVAGYEEKTKMPMFNETLNNSQVYDLIKYILTLND